MPIIQNNFHVRDLEFISEGYTSGSFDSGLPTSIDTTSGYVRIGIRIPLDRQGSIGSINRPFIFFSKIILDTLPNFSTTISIPGIITNHNRVLRNDATDFKLYENTHTIPSTYYIKPNEILSSSRYREGSYDVTTESLYDQSQDISGVPGTTRIIYEKDVTAGGTASYYFNLIKAKLNELGISV